MVFALLCSSLGYWWWSVASDGFNLKRWLIDRFPVSTGMISVEKRSGLAGLGKQLRIRLEECYVFKDNKGRIGNFHLPSCEREIAAVDSFLIEAIPALTQQFMLDIHASNAFFSRAQVTDGDD